MIEIQHGLIASSDIFYGFPKQVSGAIEKALFADKILLLGPIWNSVLENGCEYPKEKRVVVGDFFTYSESIPIVNEPNKRIILITSQTLIRDFIWNYAINLAEKIEREKLDIEIWYKPHPLEYSDMNIYDHNPCPEIISVKMENIEQLFPAVAAQISVYSTTLIDGLNFGIPAYCIEHEASADYIKEYINQKVSTLLSNDDLPLVYGKQEHLVELYKQYYSNCDDALLLKVFQN